MENERFKKDAAGVRAGTHADAKQWKELMKDATVNDQNTHNSYPNARRRQRIAKKPRDDVQANGGSDGKAGEGIDKPS